VKGNFYLIIVLTVILSSCENRNDILEIDDSERDGILFLVESANVPILEDSSELQNYLTFEEMKTAFDSVENENLRPPKFRKIEYKFYRTILKTENYQTDLLLKIDNSKWDRDYVFSLRSYDKNRNEISHLDFAQWTEGKHCFGRITEDTTIEIKSLEQTETQRYKISKKGEFLKLK
jgi:hypothetical protein